VHRSVAAGALAAAFACLFAVPAHAAGLDVEVEQDINLAGPGLIGVTVSGAGSVDPASLRVGGVEPVTSGRIDADGDGSAELVAHFDKQRLIDAGVLNEDTRRLEVSAGSLSGSDAVDVGVTLEVKLTRESDALAAYGELEPLIPRSIDVARLAKRAQARSGRPAPDMRLWYRLKLPAGTDVEATLAALRNRMDVIHADVAPDIAPPPQLGPTPDFFDMQGYLRPAPQGTGADFSLADPRTRGAGITIADLEYYWTADHEDLQLDPVATHIGGDAWPQYTNFADEHGTAVFGEMVAKDNGYGVTGGVPDATMRGMSPTRRNANGSTSYVPGPALVYLAQFLNPGDVVLIEQQTVGPNGGTAYVPLEWTQSAFDAMRMITDLGAIVVETGANGSQNLDAPEMQGRFDRNVRDSGAIIVGAASPTTRAALNFSSYGTRMDLQGWGQGITTTGLNGNLFGGTSPANLTRRYTSSMNGTSGAGPIVTNAVVAVQSYLKATGRPLLTSAQMIELLRATGTPQTGTRLVGPLPNIEAALKEIEVDPPTTAAAIAPEPVNGWYLNPTVTLTADDGWGKGVERTEYRVDGGEWATYSAPFSVTEPGAHTVEFRSVDQRGNAEEPKTVTFNTFDLDTEAGLDAGGTVPATLALTLGDSPSFGAFIPGVEQTYETSTTATVISTAGDAALTVADPSGEAPGHLVNGAFSLAEPLQVQATSAAGTGDAFGPLGTLLIYDGPVSNDTVTIAFRQHIGAAQPLRTGTYAKTLTFTLSTTNP
jgi:hypothetical protein